MVKKAYQKLFSFPIVRIGIIGIVLTVFVYRLLLFITYGDELSQTFISWICLGFACIPYQDIGTLKINRTNKNVLEILNTQGTVLHMAGFPMFSMSNRLQNSTEKFFP